MEAQALTVAHLYWVAVLMMAGYMGICETLAEQEKEQQGEIDFISRDLL